MKYLRQGKKLSQQALAEKVGISQAVISSYETNMAHPKYEQLVKLSMALDVPSDYLLGLTTEDNQEYDNEIKKDILNAITELKKTYEMCEEIIKIKIDLVFKEIEKI